MGADPRIADSGDVAQSFRDRVARCSDMMSPAWASCWCLVFGEKRAAGQSFMAGLGRVRRRLSPARSTRWALWTRRFGKGIGLAGQRLEVRPIKFLEQRAAGDAEAADRSLLV